MIILASKSPRRKELLENLGYKFEIVTSDLEEVVTKKEPAKIVLELSGQKAEDVWQKAEKRGLLTDEKNLLIAADTLVFLEDERMGKPKDKDDAVRMLKSLSGNAHKVLTGVTLYYGNTDSHKKTAFYEETKVSFYEISDEDIADYVNSGEPMDKAGAYAIQTGFCRHIKGICGEYANVVGLPVARLYQEIKKLGFSGI